VGGTTDPQVHTRSGQDFGQGNLGLRGMVSFFSSHRCSQICETLGLPLARTLPDDWGTQAASISMPDADQWLKQRRVDPVSSRWSFSSATLPGCRDVGIVVSAAEHHKDTLRELSLCGCGMGDRQADQLLSTLRKLPGLGYLNLASNKLADTACTAVARALQHNGDQAAVPVQLHTLDLSGNALTAAGVGVILDSLAVQLPRLRLLLVAGNAVSADVAERLSQSSGVLVVA